MHKPRRRAAGGRGRRWKEGAQRLRERKRERSIECDCERLRGEVGGAGGLFPVCTYAHPSHQPTSAS